MHSKVQQTSLIVTAVMCSSNLGPAPGSSYGFSRQF